MTNCGIIYLYVNFILHFLSIDGGFRPFRLCRWAHDKPCHSTSALVTTRTQPSSFSTPKHQPRNQRLQLKASTYRKEKSDEIRDWLQNRLDLTDKGIERIYNKVCVFTPKITNGDASLAISSRIESLDGKIDLLQTRLNVTDKEISKIFATSKTLLQIPSGTIARKLDWLQSRLDLDDQQLSTLVRRESIILTRSIETTISPKLIWLEGRFDLNTTQQLRTFVLKFPSILSYATESMEEKLTWYKGRFSFHDSEKAAKKIIRKAPQLLGYDVETVDEKLSWFQNRLDLGDVELSKIIQLFPSILYLNVNRKLEPHLCFLASRFCLDKRGLRTMICRFPSILGLSSENIESTMDFYEDILGKANASKYIHNSPSYLGYSLEGRLKPRLANASNLGLVIGEDVSLNILAMHTNKKWEEFIDQFSK